MDKANFVDALEAEAYEQLELIREARISRSTDPEAKKLAKDAIKIIGVYAKIRGTIANEKTNELVERRLAMVEVPPRRSLSA